MALERARASRSCDCSFAALKDAMDKRMQARADREADFAGAQAVLNFVRSCAVYLNACLRGGEAHAGQRSEHGEYTGLATVGSVFVGMCFYCIPLAFGAVGLSPEVCVSCSTPPPFNSPARDCANFALFRGLFVQDGRLAVQLAAGMKSHPCALDKWLGGIEGLEEPPNFIEALCVLCVSWLNDRLAGENETVSEMMRDDKSFELFGSAYVEIVAQDLAVVLLGMSEAHLPARWLHHFTTRADGLRRSTAQAGAGGRPLPQPVLGSPETVGNAYSGLLPDWVVRPVDAVHGTCMPCLAGVCRSQGVARLGAGVEGEVERSGA